MSYAISPLSGGDGSGSSILSNAIATAQNAIGNLAGAMTVAQAAIGELQTALNNVQAEATLNTNLLYWVASTDQLRQTLSDFHAETHPVRPLDEGIFDDSDSENPTTTFYVSLGDSLEWSLGRLSNEAAPYIAQKPDESYVNNTPSQFGSFLKLTFYYPTPVPNGVLRAYLVRHVAFDGLAPVVGIRGLDVATLVYQNSGGSGSGDGSGSGSGSGDGGSGDSGSGSGSGDGGSGSGAASRDLTQFNAISYAATNIGDYSYISSDGLSFSMDRLYDGNANFPMATSAPATVLVKASTGYLSYLNRIDIRNGSDGGGSYAARMIKVYAGGDTSGALLFSSAVDPNPDAVQQFDLTGISGFDTPLNLYTIELSQTIGGGVAVYELWLKGYLA